MYILLKASSRRILTAGMLIAGLGISSLAAAQAVTSVSVLDPTGVVYVGGFPAQVDVRLNIDARNNAGNCANSGVNRIIVDATLGDNDPVNIHSSIDITDFPAVCPAEYGFTWNVLAPGTYGLNVLVRRGSIEGIDEEEVTFEMVAVEFPAPPAVANAYLKANPSVLASKKQHGCVISQIAEMHAKDEAFGPKGGPYATPMIHQWVNSFASTCPLK